MKSAEYPTINHNNTHQNINGNLGFRNNHLHWLQVTRFCCQMQWAHTFKILKAATKLCRHIQRKSDTCILIRQIARMLCQTKYSVYNLSCNGKMISAPVYNSNRKQAPWSLYERLIAPTGALRQCDVLQQRTLAVSSSPRLQRWRQHQPIARKHAHVNTSHVHVHVTHTWWTRVLCPADCPLHEPAAADARRRCDPSQRPHATRTASRSRRYWRSGRSPQLNSNKLRTYCATSQIWR